MKNALKFLPLLLFLPLLASGQKRLNEVGAVYGAIRSMTPEAYKEAHDKYGIRWIEAWTGNLTGGTEEQYDAWIERFNNAMKGSGLKLWSVHLPFTRKAPNDLSDDPSPHPVRLRQCDRDWLHQEGYPRGSVFQVSPLLHR